MALGNFSIKSPTENIVPSKKFAVALGTTETIKAGEFVSKALGAEVVTAIADATPVVGTNFFAGLATSTSTETAALTGTVEVMELESGVVYIGTQKTATLSTQALYDAAVGNRVLLDVTSGVQTVDEALADGASNGIVIQPLDITLNPGKIAFSVRAGVNYLA